MPRPSTPLPSSEELYLRLDPPPWHAVSSVELAKLLGVHLNTVWNWKLRGNGPGAEPDDVHVRASNRVFYLPANVLAWLSAKEGAPVEAWEWNRRWLMEHRRYLDCRTREDAGPAGVLFVVL